MSLVFPQLAPWCKQGMLGAMSPLQCGVKEERGVIFGAMSLPQCGVKRRCMLGVPRKLWKDKGAIRKLFLCSRFLSCCCPSVCPACCQQWLFCWGLGRLFSLDSAWWLSLSCLHADHTWKLWVIEMQPWTLGVGRLVGKVQPGLPVPTQGHYLGPSWGLL